MTGRNRHLDKQSKIAKKVKFQNKIDFDEYVDRDVAAIDASNGQFRNHSEYKTSSGLPDFNIGR